MNQMEKLTVQSYEMIRVVGIYLQQTSDRDLQELLQQHLPNFLQCYNRLLEFSEGEELQVLLMQSLQAMLMVQEEQPPQGADLVACSYLQDMQQMAAAYAKAAIEIANPGVRQFLENSFLVINRHAYEAWQYVMKRGMTMPVPDACREAT
ncbi:spore coat protein [Ectobacillus ponti]|uniref:Spore coat protein n=1 Tax=Ectobacillus ponti TaxID=2961894 RepID=A0AA41X4R5_9BACI|nr:spore coat protein [Ectobacillus ponti]MCP8968901.1 spore coat protein [Ectobacillus ponti]